MKITDGWQHSGVYLYHGTALICDGAQIGAGSRIGPFSEIGPKAVIGEECRVEHATIEGTIGDGTKAWRYSHVMERAVVGKDSQVCNGAIVLPDAVVGDRTDIQLWCGIARLAVIGDNCFIGPNVVFCNSKNPQRGAKLEVITVKDGVSIGANCNLMAGITIGSGAVIGAGTTVTKNVTAGAKVYGVAGVER